MKAVVNVKCSQIVVLCAAEAQCNVMPRPQQTELSKKVKPKETIERGKQWTLLG